MYFKIYHNKIFFKLNFVFNNESFDLNALDYLLNSEYFFPSTKLQ